MKRTILLIIFLSFMNLFFAFENVIKDIEKMYDDLLQVNEEKRNYSIKNFISKNNLFLNEYAECQDIYWKIISSYSNIAYLKLANPLEILNEAKKISEKAVEMFPNSGKSYFWLGTLIGQIGQEKGVISSLFSIKPMRDYLEKAIELEPHYAPTYDILSKLYMQAPRRPISIGNKNTALKYRLKSVELDYENNEYRWNLYEIYIDLKKFSEASEQLNIIIENTKYSIDEKDLLIYEKAIKKLNK